MNKYVTLGLWVCSVACYSLGLVYPILSTSTELLGFKLEHSDIQLWDSVVMFWNAGSWWLAVVIFVFTFGFPIFKYGEIAIRLLNSQLFSKKVNRILHALDKWSMLDVFLVALLILNFKMNSAFIVMEVKLGTAFLAASVVLRMTLVSWMMPQKMSIKSS